MSFGCGGLDFADEGIAFGVGGEMPGAVTLGEDTYWQENDEFKKEELDHTEHETQVGQLLHPQCWAASQPKKRRRKSQSGCTDNTSWVIQSGRG